MRFLPVRRRTTSSYRSWVRLGVSWMARISIEPPLDLSVARNRCVDRRSQCGSLRGIAALLRARWLFADHRLDASCRRDRVGMPMHDAPVAIFGAQNARRPQYDIGELRAPAHPRLVAVDLNDLRQVGRAETSRHPRRNGPNGLPRLTSS